MRTPTVTLQYDSASRRPSMIGELLELIRYRDLLRMMVANIIKTRYKRWAWCGLG